MFALCISGENGIIVAVIRRNATLYSSRIFRNRIANDLDFLALKQAKVKCKYANRKQIPDFICLIEIAMGALLVTVYEIFAVEMCLTLTLIFKWSKFKCKVTNQKPINKFTYVGNCNICSICHRLRDNYVLPTWSRLESLTTLPKTCWMASLYPTKQ